MQVILTRLHYLNVLISILWLDTDDTWFVNRSHVCGIFTMIVEILSVAKQLLIGLFIFSIPAQENFKFMILKSSGRASERYSVQSYCARGLWDCSKVIQVLIKELFLFLHLDTQWKICPRSLKTNTRIYNCRFGPWDERFSCYLWKSNLNQLLMPHRF